MSITEFNLNITPIINYLKIVNSQKLEKYDK